MPDQSHHDRALRGIVDEKTRDALGVEGRQALFSAACLMAFADLELAEPESVVLSALGAYLASAPQGQRVTSRRQSRDQLLATLREAKFGPEVGDAILGCLAYIATADGIIRPAERQFLEATGAALGRDAATCEAILEKVAYT